MKLFKNLKFILIFFVIFGLLIPNFSMYVKAETTQEKLDRLQAELNEIKTQKSDLQKQLNANTYTINGYSSQISKLQGEAALYQQDIAELRIEIEQSQINIAILDSQIDDTQKEITQSENTVVSLEQESNIRIKESYYNYRMYGETDASEIFDMNNINTYFKDSQYKEIIQSDTNHLMLQLAELKQKLQDEKASLNDKLVQVKKDKEIIDIKKVNLSQKKEDVDLKLAEYYRQINNLQATTSNQKNQINSLNNSEKELSAEYLLVMQQFMTTSITSGTFVRAGTIIGFEGNTGYVYPLPTASNPTAGTHLHFSVYYNGVMVNPCNEIKPGSGCGSGNNPLEPPLRGNVILTQSFKGSAHDGIDIVATPVANQPVYAAQDGYIERGIDCWHRDHGYATNGCANFVRIHQNLGSTAGFVTGYWHLKS
jgi:peptidoglycan hydrolase CwlO-like protein